LETQISAQHEIAQELEEKIAILSITVGELNDQIAFLKQHKKSSGKMIFLERQLAGKDRLLFEMKEKADTTIAQLEQEMDENVRYMENQ
jgi:hypothetical protein